MRFVLASSSPRRREMIASLGIAFEIIKPQIDETQRAGEAPYAYVERLSREKADAVVAQIKTPPPAPLPVHREGETIIQPIYYEGTTIILAADTIVLAADTIGVTDRDGDLLGKPEDESAAHAMLKRLRDTWHTVATAFQVVVMDSECHEKQRIADRVSTRVLMRAYTDAEIAAYIATGDPFDKAGGYAIQHDGFHPVACIEGCYNNVVGLPLCAVKRALVAVGWPGIEATEGCDCPKFSAEC